MRNDITKLRWRMTNGAPIDGDLEWCQRRIQVLEEWPEELNRSQTIELTQLRTWVKEYVA